MRLPNLPFVKICCISTHAEARMAISAGASALGLVSPMPSGVGTIDNTLVAEIAATIPPPVASFLLTPLQNAEEIIVQHRLCRTSTIQLVDAVAYTELGKLRTALPGIRLVQVIHVIDQGSVDEAISVAPLVDALLLDSGNPNLAIKELGGTGRTHDWSLSRSICENAGIPVFLAGGLNQHNVEEAIKTVRPYGIDLCSGIRTDGNLDSVKLNAFMAAIRNTCSQDS